MAVIEINGQQIEVDDAFLQMTPEQQASEVDFIAKNIGAVPQESTPATPETPLADAENRIVGEPQTPVQTDQQIQDQVVRETKEPRLPTGSEFARGGLTDLAIQGATLGFSDEIMGALRGTTEFLKKSVTGEPVDFNAAISEAIDNERRAINDALNRHPVLGRAAEIVGGFAAGPVDLVKLAGSKLMTRLAVTSGEGAVFGGLAAFGFAEGAPQERVDEALVGAGIGALIGGTVPLGTTAVRQLALPLKNALRSRNPQKAAETIVLDALERDGIDLTDFAQNIRARAVGKPEALVDIAGEATLRTGKLSGDILPTAAETEVRKFLTERQFAQGDRVAEDFGLVLGDETKFFQTLDDLAKTRENLSAPLYVRSYDNASPVNTNPTLQLINKQLEVAAGPIRRALLGLRKELITPEQGQKIGLEALHNVKMVMDDMISGALKKKGAANQARVLTNVKRSLVKDMDRNNPLYKQARDIWAGSAAAEEMVLRGRDFMRGTKPPFDPKLIRDMTDSQKELFRMGIAQGMRDLIDNQRFGSNITIALFGNRRKRNILREVFPDQQSFDAFKDLMERESKITRVGQTVLGGSPTAKNIATQEGAAETLEIIDAVTRAGLTGAAAQAARTALRAAQGINPQVAERIARILFEADPQKLIPIVERLAKISKQSPLQQKKMIAKLARAAAARRAATGVAGAGVGENLGLALP